MNGRRGARVGAIGVACLVVVAAATAAATASRAERPAGDVTAYVAQLRAATALAEQAAAATGALPAGTRDCSLVSPAASKLAQAADAAKAVLQRYATARTRFGTREELELIMALALGLREGRATLARAAGESVPISAAERQAAEKEIGLFQRVVALEIGDRLRVEGLSDVLQARSFAEMAQTVVSRLQVQLRLRAEAELKRLLGFGIRLDVPLREQLHDLLQRELSRLLAKLTVVAGPAGIIVTIFGQRLFSLVGAKLQEALRNKGDLAQRTQATVQGFEQLRRDLNALPPGAALDRVRAVVRAVERAQGRTKFLVGDLTRAKRSDLLAQLEASQKQLTLTLKHTRFRFLLDSVLVGEDFGVAVRYAAKVRSESERLAKKMGCTLTVTPPTQPGPVKGTTPTSAICQPATFRMEYFSSLGARLGEYDARFKSFTKVATMNMTWTCIWAPAGQTTEAFVVFVSAIPIGTPGTIPSGNCFGTRPDSPPFYHSRTRQLTVNGGNRLSFQNAVGGNEKILKQVLAAAEAANVGDACPRR